MPPNRGLLAPACGSKTPPWRSHTPTGSATRPGGTMPIPSHDSSCSSRSGPDRRPPPQRSVPGVFAAATRQPRAASESPSDGRWGGSCSCRAVRGWARIVVAILPQTPRGVKSLTRNSLLRSAPGEPSSEQLDGGDVEPARGAFDGCFEVLGKAAVAVEPSDGSLDHPPARQELEPLGGI